MFVFFHKIYYIEYGLYSIKIRKKFYNNKKNKLNICICLKIYNPNHSNKEMKQISYMEKWKGEMEDRKEMITW